MVHGEKTRFLDEKNTSSMILNYFGKLPKEIMQFEVFEESAVQILPSNYR